MPNVWSSNLRSALTQPAALSYKALAYPDKPDTNSFLFNFVRSSWLALFAACVFQIVFFSSVANLFALGCIIIAWALLSAQFLRPDRLNTYPLSSFLLLGFTATQFYFPLLFTTLEGKPVTFNLELPYHVFGHSILSLIVLLLAHACYRGIVKMPLSNPNSILGKIGLFTPPFDLQLWLMGLIGLGATVYAYFISPSVGWEVTGAASDKAIQGLIPFSYAPFFIPFRRMYGSMKDPDKRLVPMLVAFTVLLFVVSIGRNSRGAFMIGFTSVGFGFGFALLLGIFKTRLFTLRNAALAGLAFLMVTGPIADIGTAMVIVRGQRSKISNAELIELTWQAYQDKDAIRARRQNDNTTADEWDERYLDNIFTARFSNLKFNDASLVQSTKIGDQDKDMLTYSINYILGALPDPFLKALDIDADKENVYGVSIGDYLYAEAGGPIEALGGFRTGHFAGTGMAAFGWWYLAILGFGMIPVYFLFDLFVAYVPISSKVPGTGTPLRFSLCGLLVLTGIFQFLPAESVVTTATFLLRGWVQMILLYVVLFQATRLISKVFQGSKSMNPADYARLTRR
ncbi:hypothetical protein [Hymenobacter crusticola]|uniref:O-antigen polysaccharide polymerase Wzy n=1 Tax=Hymenobacter crusticola TaxID=1770526 RepID=A0A243WFJ7_9BACT|nr:hypothetical protein [Hymenobacter crusticola]OUJ73887.1 hypothetical protein BXP70_13020 [Hymenobacter crusticola]